MRQKMFGPTLKVLQLFRFPGYESGEILLHWTDFLLYFTRKRKNVIRPLTQVSRPQHVSYLIEWSYNLAFASEFRKSSSATSFGLQLL